MHTHFNKFTHTFLIEASEWVVAENFRILIGWQEARGVVTRQSKSGLGEVVSSEGEELCVLSHLISGDCSAGNLDHGSNRVLQLGLLESELFANTSGGIVDDLLLEFKLTSVGDEWDHDFREYLCSFSLNRSRSFKDSLDLSSSDSRVADAETATAVTEHRVLFVKIVNPFRDGWCAHSNLFGKVLLLNGIHSADEFVKWWIEEADRCGATCE